MNKNKRVVVTGMSVVSCLGQDPEQYHQNLLMGKSGVSFIENFDCQDLPTRFAGQVRDFEVGDLMDKKQARRADTYIRYAVVAGKKALSNAGVTPEELEKLDRSRCGVLIGSGMGGMDTYTEGVQTVMTKGYRKLTPFFVPYIITNMGGAMLAMDIGFLGPNYSISTACATASFCMINAANHIRQGHADLMICGGVEATVSHVGIIGFISCRALSQFNEDPSKASRPWDKKRDGFVLGEGAGVLVLESYEHAMKRGATILGEYLGGAFSCDAHHLTEPRSDGKGIALCISQALKDAGISSNDVGYANAHATSTPAGDMAEINAIKQVFQDPKKLLINSTKSMIGHALGAAGGLEAVATIKQLNSGRFHPTINLEDPEPGILDFDVPTQAVSRDIPVGISLSFGFGGHNAAVVFKRAE